MPGYYDTLVCMLCNVADSSLPVSDSGKVKCRLKRYTPSGICGGTMTRRIELQMIDGNVRKTNA